MSIPLMALAQAVRFSQGTLLPDDPRSRFSRAVNFAPADGQACDLNPPRFRWQYHPTEPGQGGDYLFTFQVAHDPEFRRKILDVETEFNFFNTIRPFEGPGPYYWRIGYRDRLDPDAPLQWSQVRRFCLTPEARVWDRSMLAEPDFASRPHPRILIGGPNLARLRQLIRADAETRAIFERMTAEADESIASEWWRDFPRSDREPHGPGYLEMASRLVNTAFVWRVTGEAKYASVKERALLMARYPKGGRAGPQDAGGDSAEDSTQSTEFLALLYDWLWPDLSADERRDFAACLDWRIEHFVNHFAWKYEARPRTRRASASAPASTPTTTAATGSPRAEIVEGLPAGTGATGSLPARAAATSGLSSRDAAGPNPEPGTRNPSVLGATATGATGSLPARAAATTGLSSRAVSSGPAATQPTVYWGSLSTTAGSHQYEGFWDTFPAAIAAYEDSPNARLCFHLGVNYMVGVGSGHGQDEGWNEGPGYGNSKFAWLVNSMSYLDSVFPEFGIGRNPWLGRMGEYFRAVTPVGLRHAPWGHGSNKPEYFETGHRKSYRKLAYLTGDGRWLANWTWYAAQDPAGDDTMRPWIECALPAWRDRPEPVTQEEPVRLFPLAGWVTALSGPPNGPDTYARGVGMIFACRPTGAYSHAFACDNSFHVFAYGQDISHAAGTSDYEPHAYHTMSHNAILVDGLGQAQGRQMAPRFGRILAFGQQGDVVYWCGDATLCYPRTTTRPGSWWGRLGEVYTQRDLSYLTRVNRHVLFLRKKYFVILDDLAAAQPARWTWLYHVLDSERMNLDERTGSFGYVIGGVPVQVTHLVGSGQLDVQDRQGAEGFQNPITGEDYTDQHGSANPQRRFVAKHNLWLTTRDKHAAWRFLSVIYPTAPDQPAAKVERLDDLTLRVSAGPDVDVISFDPATSHPATIIVDLPAIAPGGAARTGARDNWAMTAGVRAQRPGARD